MRFLAMLACVAMLICLGILPGHAERRVALVIGNSIYRHAGELTNPKNDAADMAAALKKVGFQVIEGFDLDKTAFDRKVREFVTALTAAEAGLFFYAGHGLQVGGQNYLMPVDAELTTAASLEFEMVRLDIVQRIMEGSTSTNILFLDACRNNPLARNLARALGTRSAEIGRGLAPVESGSGTLISFSTQPGNVALDGAGRNSPFAGSLAKHISESNEDLSALLIGVRNDVIRETQRRQVPWEHSALTQRFFFKVTINVLPPAQSVQPAQPRQEPSEAERNWLLVKETTNRAILEEFIKQYGGTFYAILAQARLEELKNQQTAVSPPQQQSTPPRPEPQVAAVVPPVVPARPCEGVALASLSSRTARPLIANEECALKPKDVFKECAKCPEMVVVPAGSFTMGSPASEEGRSKDEGPQHLVTFAKPFAVARFAITFEQWDACLADNGCDGVRISDFSWGRGNPVWGRGNRSVTNVYWSLAKAYVAWLSRKSGKPYRLLTESEREYVTRAGTATPFWWGATISAGQSSEPNPWGLYQVHGNIWEWTEDCWHDTYLGAPSDGSAWEITNRGSSCAHALRGGFWQSAWQQLRSAARLARGPAERADDIGFRVARTLTAQ